jgi:hypothetical protein
LRELCQDKSSCDIVANNDNFVDNCKEVHKVLKVWYQCVNTPVKTTGGNANGKNCVFPFKYNNADHYQCTYENHTGFNNTKWCCTTYDCDAVYEWGECPGKF